MYYLRYVLKFHKVWVSDLWKIGIRGKMLLIGIIGLLLLTGSILPTIFLFVSLTIPALGCAYLDRGTRERTDRTS